MSRSGIRWTKAVSANARLTMNAIPDSNPTRPSRSRPDGAPVAAHFTVMSTHDVNRLRPVTAKTDRHAVSKIQRGAKRAYREARRR